MKTSIITATLFLGLAAAGTTAQAAPVNLAPSAAIITLADVTTTANVQADRGALLHTVKGFKRVQRGFSRRVEGRRGFGSRGFRRGGLGHKKFDSQGFGHGSFGHSSGQNSFSHKGHLNGDLSQFKFFGLK